MGFSSREITRCGPWSAWSGWGEKSGFPYYISARVRTRSCTVSNQTRRVRWVPRSLMIGNYRYCYLWQVTGPWRTMATRTYTEEDYEYDWFDPPKPKLPISRLFIHNDVKKPIFHNNRIRFDGRWLRKNKEIISFTLTLDGEKIPIRKWINLSDFYIGEHLLTITAKTKKGKKEFHYFFKTINQIELSVTNSQRIKRLNEKTRKKFMIKVKNNTNLKTAVKMKVTNVPRGFMVGFDDKEFFEIKSKSTHSIKLLVDYTGINKLPKKLIAFNVIAESIHGQKDGLSVFVNNNGITKKKK